MDTFNWPVDIGAGIDLTFRNKEVQFGNGYKQVVPDGINTVTESWSISMEGYQTALAPAYAFLNAHAGAASFLWLTPLGDTIQVLGKGVKLVNREADVYVLSATFEQSFTPT